MSDSGPGKCKECDDSANQGKVQASGFILPAASWKNVLKMVDEPIDFHKGAWYNSSVNVYGASRGRGRGTVGVGG